MELIVNDDLANEFSGKYIFLDNDFLGKIFSDKYFCSTFIKLTKLGYLFIDSLTEFEFKRDLYYPTLVENREEFINKNFNIAIEHNDIYKEIKKNALLLSKIYKFQNQSDKISFIDLMLAGRVMSKPEKYILITGNRKDFPPCIFDNQGVLNTEDPKSGTVRAYSVLKFNKEKFDDCYKDLLTSEKRILEKLNTPTTIKPRINQVVYGINSH